MRFQNDPDGTRLPIKLDSASNGEFEPVPLPAHLAAANREALRVADWNARRRGTTRRGFLVSLCGAATVLLTLNRAHAAAGRSGGAYAVPKDAQVDPDLAAEVLGKREFIFDVQGHHVNAEALWRRPQAAWNSILQRFPNASCGAAAGSRFGHLECFSAQSFVKDVFLDSDTDMAVLSFVPAAGDDAPLAMEEAAATRAIVQAMEGNHRLLLHAPVFPNLPGSLDSMDEAVERWGVSAWKTYTQFGPGGGYRLDDPGTGIPFIEKARALGVKVICIHKGIPLGRDGYEYSTCRDIGVAARRYPDVSFLVYHAGFEPGLPEQPFAPGAGRGGIDTLVQSLLDNGIAPNSNVYAELGSTWRFLMRDPDSAAHALGKLFKHVGERNVLWGTDSVWYGSPQDQIQAFRAFQIAEPLRERHGYPAIDAHLRARVFGLNALVPYGISVEEAMKRASNDDVAAVRTAYREHPDPHFRTNGPRTRREFLRLHALRGPGPA
jgi:hypothetical protein